MFREPVTSTVIAAIGYDEEAETLEVEFASGVVYRYRCISLDLFEDFRTSPSKGKFFNRYIKERLPVGAGRVASVIPAKAGTQDTSPHG